MTLLPCKIALTVVSAGFADWLVFGWEPGLITALAFLAFGGSLALKGMKAGSGVTGAVAVKGH